jgi:RNA polymerase sigma-70 factor (ECF subfamily)
MNGQEKVADSITQHLPYLHRMVRGLTRGDPMAEDIVQQTILKALVHTDQFRLESTLKTWLTSITMNEVRQVYRCKWRMRSVPLMTENGEGEQSPLIESPHAGYQAREREVLIRQAVSRLPEPYRCVVELCDLQCLPLQESAAQLRLTLAAVKTRRHRARKMLRALCCQLETLNDPSGGPLADSPKGTRAFLTERESETPHPSPSLAFLLKRDGRADFAGSRARNRSKHSSVETAARVEMSPRLGTRVQLF